MSFYFRKLSSSVCLSLEYKSLNLHHGDCLIDRICNIIRATMVNNFLIYCTMYNLNNRIVRTHLFITDVETSDGYVSSR